MHVLLELYKIKQVFLGHKCYLLLVMLPTVIDGLNIETLEVNENLCSAYFTKKSMSSKTCSLCKNCISTPKRNI